MRLETHVHTKYSHDSLLCFWMLCARCMARKINYIAVTEHNNIDGAIAFKHYCEKRGNKLKVIIGEEIMTDNGEIIGLYLKETVPAGMSTADTIQKIKEQGGIVYVPHPYDEKRAKTVLCETALTENLDEIDCIECHNGRNISQSFDKKQTEIADKYNLTKVIGSDAHTLLEIGRNYMEIDIEPSDADHFRDAIKMAKFHQVKCIRICHQITKAARVIKIVKRGAWDELYRIVNRKFTR